VDPFQVFDQPALAAAVRVGDVADFRTFLGAVIDRAAYDSIVVYVELARSSPQAEIVVGGGHDDSRGYFIQPTVIETADPKFETREEEIFGPVLTVHVYPDGEFKRTLDLHFGR